MEEEVEKRAAVGSEVVALVAAVRAEVEVALHLFAGSEVRLGGAVAKLMGQTEARRG